MAARWSNPSGSIGVERFRVWPAEDDHYDHVELARNWDRSDAIIGIPSDGTEWPPTEGVDGGIYAEIQTMKLTVLPLGMVLSWWRPSTSVSLPAGWEVCDGSVVAEADHDFGAIGAITLPDMRNRFAIGANNATAIGTAGVAVSHADVNAAAGAPGPQGTGGINAATLSLAQMAAHNHGASTTHKGAPALHWYNQTTPGDLGIINAPAGEFEKTPGVGTVAGGGLGAWRAGQHRHLLNDLTNFGSGETHENRPRYVGLLYLVKVRNVE